MAIELRCSPAVRGLGVDPVGSAASGSSLLLVDLPLPWQHDLAADPRLEPLHAAVAALAERGHPWRVQATAPDGPEHQVVAHHRPAGAAAGFVRRARPAAPGDAVAVALALLAEEGEGPTGPAHPGRELLLCTHGARDVCCGGPGTALWKDLLDRGGLPGDVALRRTSHTGGHRFAPTGVLLPEGSTWAWLDAPLVHAVLTRAGDAAAAAERYRGNALAAGAVDQVVDRALLATVGWTWFDHVRSTTVAAEGPGAWRVTVDAAHDERRRRWAGRVREVGRTPVPTCGEPLEAAPKTAAVLELDGPLEELVAPSA